MDTDPRHTPRKTEGTMTVEDWQRTRVRPKPAVCRRLFSDDEDDHEDGRIDNMMNKMSEEINRRMDEACEKYNFDFRTERPLEGDWVWELLVPEEDAAARADTPVTGETGKVQESESVATAAVDSSQTPTQTVPQ